MVVFGVVVGLGLVTRLAFGGRGARVLPGVGSVFEPLDLELTLERVCARKPLQERVDRVCLRLARLALLLRLLLRLGAAFEGDVAEASQAHVLRLRRRQLLAIRPLWSLLRPIALGVLALIDVCLYVNGRLVGLIVRRVGLPWGVLGLGLRGLPQAGILQSVAACEEL